MNNGVSRLVAMVTGPSIVIENVFFQIGIAYTGEYCLKPRALLDIRVKILKFCFQNRILRNSKIVAVSTL